MEFDIKKVPADLTGLVNYDNDKERLVLFGGRLYVKKIDASGRMNQLQDMDFAV